MQVPPSSNHVIWPLKWLFSWFKAEVTMEEYHNWLVPFCIKNNFFWALSEMMERRPGQENPVLAAATAAGFASLDSRLFILWKHNAERSSKFQNYVVLCKCLNLQNLFQNAFFSSHILTSLTLRSILGQWHLKIATG